VGPKRPGHEELCGQLAGLRERVAAATCGAAAPGEVRAELATLLFFAKMLRGDAEAWRAGIHQAVQELERKRAAAQRERERAAAEQAQLQLARDALQLQIDHAAGRIARQKGGECRRTVPVVTLRPGLTVSSMTVSSSRRRFRSLKLWLVTLDAAREGVQVVRD
jgi:hypothetical protein